MSRNSFDPGDVVWVDIPLALRPTKRLGVVRDAPWRDGCVVYHWVAEDWLGPFGSKVGELEHVPADVELPEPVLILSTRLKLTQ